VVTIANGGQFTAGASQTIRSLNDAGAPSSSLGALVTLNGSALTIGDATNAPSTFSGNIKDGSAAGSIVKAGTGTLTLAGANSYSGGTTIQAGTVMASQPGTLGTGPITIGHNTTLAIGAPQVAVADFNNVTLNGTGGNVSGTTLQLTNGLGGEASSAFLQPFASADVWFQCRF
jgi:autotransporter-associated beta strand protein